MDDADTSTLAPEPITPPQAPEASTPPPSAEPSAPAAAVAVPEAPKTRREVIERAVKASQTPADGKTLREKMIENGTIRPAGEKPRAPDGKFVAGTPAAPKAAIQAAAAPAAALPAASALAPIPLPKALKAELGAVWGKTDRAMQEAVAKYVEDASKGIEIHRTKANQADAILAEFKPYEALLRSEGGTPQRAIRDLLNTSYVLRTGTPQQKAMLVAQTMQNFGIPVETLAQVLQGGGAQPQGGADPRYEQLERQVQSFKTLLNQQQERQYTSIADSFGRDKAHWELLKPHVAGILSRGEIQGAETMSELEILDAAYKQALQQYPVISSADAEAQRQTALKAERDKANALAAASRAAAVQVTGAPGGAAAAAFDPKDRRSVLRHALAARTV